MYAIDTRATYLLEFRFAVNFKRFHQFCMQPNLFSIRITSKRLKGTPASNSRVRCVVKTQHSEMVDCLFSFKTRWHTRMI